MLFLLKTCFIRFRIVPVHDANTEVSIETEVKDPALRKVKDHVVIYSGEQDIGWE